MYGTSYGGVAEVDKRTDSTFSLTKSSGVRTLTSSPPWAPSAPLNVCQSLLMFPLHALISSCQYFLFYFSYNAHIFLNSSDHARLTSSQRVRRNIFQVLSHDAEPLDIQRHQTTELTVCVYVEQLQVDSGGLTVLSTLD